MSAERLTVAAAYTRVAGNNLSDASLRLVCDERTLMGLRDLDLRTDYRSGRDAMLDDFYVPCLQEAVQYDRAVGYFSSTLLHVVALAYSDFVRRGGQLRLICSPALKPEDFEAMKDAEEIGRHAQALARAELQELLARPEAMPATRLLATLVANGIAEVRIAFATNPSGIFHDKLGVFEDLDGKRVTFVGSANETWAAWGLNHESFEVFCSWRGESELLRTRNHSDSFTRLWRGHEPGVRVEQLDRVTRDQLLTVADDDVDRAIDGARVRPRQGGVSTARPLMEHQIAVVADWVNHGHHGVVNFATGAGKTLAALEAVRIWTANGRPAVVLVPGRDLHKQWSREIEQELSVARLLLAGAGSDGAAWRQLLSSWTKPESASAVPRVVLTTNSTFSSADFQARLRAGEHLLVVADEMHRAGSSRVITALEATTCGATLGLSATYRRQFDSAGTDRLLAFFGPVLSPVIGLAEALIIGQLVPYDYWLHTLTPDDDELEQYQSLTDQISKVAAQDNNFDSGPSEYLKMLLIKRGRLLKQASGKAPRAAQILREEYRDGDRWLAYCDDTTQLNALVRLCLDAGLPTMEYHSAMQGDRDSVLRSLADNGGIVVAIRCLDEGVDIPVTDHALILASSTAEREYIQRRGRVLRRAPDKLSAQVHDLLLTDPGGGALTRSEAVRALEFARLARNSSARENLKLLLALSPDIGDLPGLEDDEEIEND